MEELGRRSVPAVQGAASSGGDADVILEYWRHLLRESTDVYSYLRSSLEHLGLGEGIVEILERVEVARLAVHQEWSTTWAGWAELVLKIRTMESSGSEDYMEDALGCISEVVRRFVQHAESLGGGSNFPTDRERLGELVADGFVHGHGKVWGDSNCLVDSLLPVSYTHLTLPTSDLV